MQLTPEQIQQELRDDRINNIYDQSRDSILAHVSRAYAEMTQAVAEWQVLELRISMGDMTSVTNKHATMTVAMAGQDGVIQTAFVDCTAVLESAQEIVYNVTGRAFIKGVPLPPEEPEPVE